MSFAAHANKAHLAQLVNQDATATQARQETMVLPVRQDRTRIRPIPCFRRPNSVRANPIQDRPVHQVNADSQVIPVVLATPVAMDVPVHRDRPATKERLAKAADPDRKAHLARPERRVTRPRRSLDVRARLDKLDDLVLLASQEHLEATAITANPDDLATMDAQVHPDALALPVSVVSQEAQVTRAAATTARPRVWRQAIRSRTKALDDHSPCDCAHRHITSLSLNQFL
jgi:hypothetical protein